jgi:hypothetical protein
MTIDFDFARVRATEFGVGRDDHGGQSFCFIPVDGDVQAALREMAEATWQAMDEMNDSPPSYEPSEKYAGTEYVQLPLQDDFGTSMRELHQANNLPINAMALSDPGKIYCYFARLMDQQGRRLTALRRATQFKGVLRSRLIRLVTDALKLVEDKIFKLDNDFDLLIDATDIHILRPSGFEFASGLQEAVLDAVPENVKFIQRDLKFVDFTSVQAYASKHPRAARYLASIRSQDTKNVDKGALKKLCKSTGVTIGTSNGKITVEESHVMGFLEVLDRRRYELELVKGSAERFKAASRRRIEE